MAHYHTLTQGFTGPTRRASFIAGLAWLSLIYCGPARMPAETPAVPVSAAGKDSKLYAGVERIDITPPPGVATFGHGPNARVAAGYWTRLECRAFVFLPPSKNIGTAFVPCDLAAVSTLLQRTVATRLHMLGTNIPPQRLFVSATHTHAGPAHYFDAEFYGGMASTQGPGFDPRVLDFLASRIASAVHHAYGMADRARREGRPALIRWIHGNSWGLTHNRSLDAFSRNRSPSFPYMSPPDGYRDSDPASLAIDPNMDVLDIAETVDGRLLPLGWIGFFAMHPTVLSHDNRHLGGDVFGVASRLLEQELRRYSAEKGHPNRQPLVAFINTNEGDMSPRWSTGDRGEVIAFGRRLADEVLRIYKEQIEKPYKDEVPFSTSYLEVRLPNNSYGLKAGKHLCDQAQLGEPSIWGAIDHPTYLLPLRDSMAPPRFESFPPPTDTSKNEKCQAPKKEALGILQRFFASEGAFPVTIPLGLSRVDDTWIAFVPAELTITVGWRIRNAILSAITKNGPSMANHQKVEVRIGGLTNGYIEYVATEEEYQLQRYEGASTLYGPMMSSFLQSVFRSMAERMLTGKNSLPSSFVPEVASDFQYQTGPERHRLASSFDEPTAVQPISLCLIRPYKKAAPVKFCFVWEDGPPNVYSSPPRRPVHLVSIDTGWKRIALRVRLSNGLASDSISDPFMKRKNYILGDDGFEFLTTVHGRSQNGWVWSTLFTPTQEEWEYLKKQPQRFVIRVGDHLRAPIVQSIPFTFGNQGVTVSECTLKRAGFCEGEN